MLLSNKACDKMLHNFPPINAATNLLRWLVRRLCTGRIAVLVPLVVGLLTVWGPSGPGRTLVPWLRSLRHRTLTGEWSTKWIVARPSWKERITLISTLRFKFFKHCSLHIQWCLPHLPIQYLWFQLYVVYCGPKQNVKIKEINGSEVSKYAQYLTHLPLSMYPC
jgi:hypothetical protein